MSDSADIIPGDRVEQVLNMNKILFGPSKRLNYNISQEKWATNDVILCLLIPQTPLKPVQPSFLSSLSYRRSEVNYRTPALQLRGSQGFAQGHYSRQDACCA